MTEYYGADVPLVIRAEDKLPDLRKFLRKVGSDLASMIIRTWLSDPGAYKVAIRIVMEKTP